MTRIRPADLSDEAQLFDLVRSFPTPTPCDSRSYTAALRIKLADSSSFIAVADDEQFLSGYVAGSCHATFYASGWIAWVDEILVRPERRGHGIGRMLMEAFEHWARSKNCRLVSLATAGAGPFYEHLGYATKAAYYKKYLSGQPS